MASQWVRRITVRNRQALSNIEINDYKPQYALVGFQAIAKIDWETERSCWEPIESEGSPSGEGVGDLLLLFD